MKIALKLEFIRYTVRTYMSKLTKTEVKDIYYYDVVEYALSRCSQMVRLTEGDPTYEYITLDKFFKLVEDRLNNLTLKTNYEKDLLYSVVGAKEGRRAYRVVTPYKSKEKEAKKLTKQLNKLHKQVKKDFIKHLREEW